MLDGPAAEVESMSADLRRALEAYPAVDLIVLNELEHDLHVRCLSRCRNLELLRSLERTRCVLTLSKHVLGEPTALPENAPFMAEHLAVLEAVSAGDVDRAAGLLRGHLEVSCMKVIRRAELVRGSSMPPERPYIHGGGLARPPKIWV
jgi:DNA-binding GntR family transcriptional regulator